MTQVGVVGNSFSALRGALSSPEFLYHFDADGQGGWWFDVRRRRAMLGGKAIDDAMLVRIKAWVVDCATWTTGDGPRVLIPNVLAVDEMATLLCDANRRDEVVDYLSSVRWDGQRRLLSDLPTALGLSLDNPVPVEFSMLRRWVVSAAARALRPGCKADCALVLLGAQGIGKSRFLQMLFGSQWVHDSAVDLEGKDGQGIMSRAWCVELAELSAMRKARDVEAVKHWLSLCEDTFRPPYARREVTLPRRGVACGTTNEPEFLQDSTGERRFWPVRIVRPVDLEWLTEYRDRLWAEAVAELEGGEQWHLNRPESEAHVEAAKPYRISDEWASLVSEWLTGRTESEFTLSNVATGALGLTDAQLGWGEQRRLVTALRSALMEVHHTRHGNVWRRSEASAAKK